MMGIDGNQLRKSREDLMVVHLFNSTAARGEISPKEDGKPATPPPLRTFRWIPVGPLYLHV